MKGYDFLITGKKASHFIYGKSTLKEEANIVSSFSISKDDVIAIKATSETVMMVATPTALLIGKYDDKAMLEGTPLKDLHSYFDEHSSEVSESEGHIYAGTVFANREITEDELNLLKDKGYLEASKSSQGKRYLDLPVLAILYLREMGLKMVDIYVDRLDPILEEKLNKKDEGTNLIVLKRN